MIKHTHNPSPLSLLPEITASQENFRVESFAPGMGIIRRDPVEPVPVGTYVVQVWRVVAYDPDCDGSLMARLEPVDRHGEVIGSERDCVGLYPDCDLVVGNPEDLWLEAEHS